MRFLFFPIFLVLLLNQSFAQSIDWSGNTSPDYFTLINYYKQLAKKDKRIELYCMGNSDCGVPIFLCVLNGSGDSTATFEKARSGTTILINNAIHPGEPDGVNACAIWIEKQLKLKSNPASPLVAIIPAYNVGGMLNRNGVSRVNQVGPEEYGFRGSGRNFDLNRDFIKMDTENSFTFSTIFQALQADVFVDTHVSNGADYQYTLTYISSLKQRLAPSIASLTYDELLPIMHKKLKMVPYVELKGDTPESGIVAFNDLPRYAMGYASLFHAISFTVETHMLKPFPERVKVTEQFIDVLYQWTNQHMDAIENARKQAGEWAVEQEHLKFNYSLIAITDSIEFLGYEATRPIHPTTEVNRLYYDRSKPYKKYIPYFNHYHATDSISIPHFYSVAGKEKAIIERLKANGVIFQVVDSSYKMKCKVAIVRDFSSLTKPWEGHFKHSNTKVEFIDEEVIIEKGDVRIDAHQFNSQFIHAVLQPQMEDSYFSWNFFDSYLQQKEYFSAYVFVDKIDEILTSNPTLKSAFETRKLEDLDFRNSETMQLHYLYQNSPYFELSYMRLPVYFID